MPQKNTNGQIGTKTAEASTKHKCLYLLHGLSDDHTIWLRRTAIERYADAHGICVVMPNAGKSYYTDMKYGGAYYSYIAEELPAVMKEFFNISDKREDTYIGGLSMGGYGALKIALRNTDRYCAAIALSPVANIKVNHRDLKISIWGENLEIPPEDDIYELVRAKDNNALKPKIYHAVGTKDFMYEDNVKLKNIMNELHYDYTYSETENQTHCWDFWDEEIKKSLDLILSDNT